MSPSARSARSPKHLVEVQRETVSVPVASSRLADLSRNVLRALRIPRAMLSITFVSARRMAALNKQHLGHQGPTDVITFALGTDPVNGVQGDIYICPEVARRQAGEHRVGVREEIARLVVHGTLHACGWEHPEDDARTTSPMWRRQEQLMQRFWLTPAQGA
ncbi:MAG: rRNA maturation RNase YbeY [Gemmatimonadaceae bacterium]|nr:rRNA maturation RNase YbeY [Gemmatimonadaceae bacterium]